MAIDFFIMPFSRYLSGDFVTPTMQLAWSLGKPYTLLGGVAPRQIPPGEPFGGPDAPARRKAFLAPDMLPGDLAQYPAPIARALWDEGSSVEPRFHRVDPASYGELLDEARQRKGSHLASAIFLPVPFDEPFTTKLVFVGWPAGSAPVALRELAETPENAKTAAARATLRAALEDAMALRLPMLVDT